MQQSALPLVWQENFSADNYIAAACNEAAFAAIKNPQGWATPVLLLLGPQDSGKTHLAHIFRQLHDAVALDDLKQSAAQDFRVIDGIDKMLLANPLLNEDLFHLVNETMLHQKRLLLTAEHAPNAWAVLPDLLSRLNASQQVTLTQPDEVMIKGAYQKLFHDRGLFVDDKVLEYIAVRSERSFCGIKKNVDTLDRLALEQGRKITIPLIQQAELFTLPLFQ